MIYTNTTEAGMSGGPIFNSGKELVGIHGRGEINQIANPEFRNVAKTNINLGIPIYFYDQYIRGLPISSLSNDATTWDDYYALYSSLEAQSQISKDEERKIDLVPTELKFLNKMISIAKGSMICIEVAAIEMHHLEKI